VKGARRGMGEDCMMGGHDYAEEDESGEGRWISWQVFVYRNCEANGW